MAGLVDKVKQSIRSRSRHRKSGSQGSVRGSQEFNRASLDQDRQYGHTDDERFSRSPVSSPNAPARHVHSGPGNQANKPLPSEPAANGTNSAIRDDIESNRLRRDSIPRKPIGVPTEHIPERSSSIRRSMPGAFDDDGSQDYERSGHGMHTAPAAHSTSSTHQTSRQPNLGLSTNGNSHDKSLVDTMNSLNFDDTGHVTVHNPNHDSAATNVGTSKAATTGHRISDHIRLPEGFHTGHKETTHVTTDVRQPVTQERVHVQRTEIVQEAITRDIHVHHYYTYLQPVRVVETLPARHFMYDSTTGQKTEIQAPAGWVMPENMHPHTPDTTKILGSTRHYMVDEQHPRGIPEAPPVENLNAHHGQHQEQNPVGRAV